MLEEQLIRRAQQGDNGAFEELLLLHQKKVYNLCLRMSANPDDALDLSQEAFLRAWRSLGQYQFEASFSTWLFRLTQEQYNYKMAAVIGIMVFIICAVFTLVCFRFLNKKEATFS